MEIYYCVAFTSGYFQVLVILTPRAIFAALNSLSSGASGSALSNVGSCQAIKALMLQRIQRRGGIKDRGKENKRERGKKKGGKCKMEDRGRTERKAGCYKQMRLYERVVQSMAFLKMGDALMFRKSIHRPAISDACPSCTSFVSFYWNVHIFVALFSFSQHGELC